MLRPLLASLTHEPAICTHVHAASIRQGLFHIRLKLSSPDVASKLSVLQIFINNRAGMGKIFEKKEEKREKVEMQLALRGHVTNASFKQ